jgi:protein TonB
MSSIRWEDMVFMNRNQSYGAYLLRKAYPDRVNLSFAFAMMVVALILFSPNIKAMFVGGDELVVADPKVEKFVEMIIVPPIEIPVIPPPRVTLPKTAVFLAPRVTDNEVVDIPPTIDELRQTNVSDDTGDDVVFVEPPAVIELPPAATGDLNKVWTFVEIAPEFPGGLKEMMKFIGSNMKYPATARRMGTEGTVFLSFVVDTDGTITNVETINGISGDCDKEAMRVIGKMPKWKPGRQGGSAVKVKFVLPIKFKLGS